MRSPGIDQSIDRQIGLALAGSSQASMRQRRILVF
jgi:hypothetical protein